KRQGYEFVTIRDIFMKSGIKPEHNVVYMSVDEVRENYR
ncbi:MAG TPA: xylanase deacetylase, partial [Lachnoclostridium sp.]|nr:xylanase deacetylase [Lachnoclostridium sp.]